MAALRETPVSIEQLALECVVGTTAELNVLDRSLASHAIRLHVMELDEGLLVATSPALAREGAGTAVTDPHHAPDLGRDMPAAGSRTATGPRPIRHRALLPR